MSFQSAYSLELKQYVTPKEAFDFSCSRSKIRSFIKARIVEVC